MKSISRLFPKTASIGISRVYTADGLSTTGANEKSAEALVKIEKQTIRIEPVGRDEYYEYIVYPLRFYVNISPSMSLETAIASTSDMPQAQTFVF